MKPSEQDPGACMLLAQMAQDAGLPDGVLNIIHGQKEGQLISLLLISLFSSSVTHSLSLSISGGLHL